MYVNTNIVYITKHCTCKNNFAFIFFFFYHKAQFSFKVFWRHILMGDKMFSSDCEHATLDPIWISYNTQNFDKWRFSFSVISLIDYLLFYVPFEIFFTRVKTSPLPVKGCKMPMLGAQGLWTGRDLYCATPAVTRGLDFSGLIRRTVPFRRLLRHRRGCWGGPILTWNLAGPHSVACTTVMGCWDRPKYFYPDPNESPSHRHLPIPVFR
jgi:hypothetical protein